MNKNQTGFTLVELVVVILILGILSATALPRFMNVSAQANSAAVAGAAGGLGAGIALAHAQWVANNLAGAQANVLGFGDDTIDVNAQGWPTDTAGDTTNIAAGDEGRCTAVWNGVMQNPPSTNATALVADYQTTISGTNCAFIYQANTTKSIQYDSTNGAVILTNP